ncbi:deoxyribose-phosphate aldolase [uncultured Flavobacterium sp.]|uniref:deoxyribose-phosphate aldolase n=1 Tax=uncultured Flavobacterium sp. TaxID=165435 RepID=UPI0030C85A9A
MNIKQFLDSTYLKTAQQATVSKNENIEINKNSIQEAIDFGFKLIMIRPEVVFMAKKMISDANSKVTIGTVIDFPLGQKTLEYKLNEAQNAIDDGADDLDFVVNYEAYKEGKIDLIKNEVLKCTALGLQNNKIVKWIIEVAALNDSQIIGLCTLIKNVVVSNFKESQYENVFVKSSTGFYQTQNNLPNGATIHAIQIMLENSFPLPVKAAGGVRNYEEAMTMIKLGVKRIGTSSAKVIVEGNEAKNEY